MNETIKCIECGEDFAFTEGEQKYYEEKGFLPPKRCKKCRDKRKLEKNTGTKTYKGRESYQENNIHTRYGN